MHYFLGLDIGTTHSKAVLMDEKALVIASCQSTHATHRPRPGYEEQDPEEVFTGVLNVLREAIAKLPSPDALQAVGISSAMHSMLAVDTTGKPLTRAMIWSDQRSEQQVEQLRRTPLSTTIYQQTGTPLHPMSPLFKIRWLQENQPAIFSQAFKFISLKEYIWFRFFGEYCIDHSIASATGLLNLEHSDWSTAALAWAGISADRLSTPVSPTYLTHGLSDDIRKQIALPVSCAPAWVIGASDGALANLGSGCCETGDAALTIGTSGAVRITATDIRTDPGQRLFTYHLVPGLFICGGAINNGGIALQWVADLLAGQKNAPVEPALQLAQKAEPGAGGLLFLPYLLGERAPVWDAEVRGMWIGIGIEHNPEHLIRSVLEAVCYSLRELIVLIEEAYGPVKQIAASGGFIQSDFWVQLLANISGKPLHISHNPDASAVGAVFVAMQAMGLFSDWTAIRQFLPPSPVIQPEVEHADYYNKQFARYRKMYAVAKLFEE